MSTFDPTETGIQIRRPAIMGTSTKVGDIEREDGQDWRVVVVAITDPTPVDREMWGDILRRGDRIETLTLEPWTIGDRMATASELWWAEFRDELEHGPGWSAGEGAAGAFDHEEAMAVVDELVRVFRYERPLR